MEIELDDETIDKDRGQRPHNFEDVVVAMGPPGRYQILQFLLLSINILPSVFINMSFVFIGLEPPFSCSPVNETEMILQSSYNTNATDRISVKVFYEACDIRISSNLTRKNGDFNKVGCIEGYIYSGSKQASIVTEWDLVCDSRGQAELAQTAVALGWFLGILLASTISDHYGRKKTILIATILMSISELSCAFAPNIYALIALRFFSGFFGTGIGAITLVLGTEMLVSKHREIYGIYIGILWSLYSLILCGIAYIFRDASWRDFQLCLAICCMSPLLFIYFVHESASWLYSKGSHRQASKIIKKACDVNGRSFGDIQNVWGKLCVQHNGEKSAKDYNMLDIFRHKNLRTHILIGCMATFSNDISYMGMYFSASNLAGNLYLNTALMALLEIPGCFITLVMLKYKGRRFVITCFMTMGAFFIIVSTCLASEFIPKSQHIANSSTAFFLLGRFAISNSYSSIYIYIPELFPTTLRSTGMGITVTGACLGSMLAPYLVSLYDAESWAPGTCLVVTLTISTLFLLKLPETKGKQLASTIEEQDNLAL